MTDFDLISLFDLSPYMLYHISVKKKKKEKNKAKDNSNMILGSGVALGALTVAEFALVGAVCPACVVGAPFLIGLGVAKKIQDKKLKENSDKISPKPH